MLIKSKRNTTYTMLGLQIIMSCPHITLYTGMTKCKNIFPRLVVACLRTQILISRRNTYCVPHHTAIFKNTSLYFNRLLVFHLTVGGWRPQEGSLLWFTWNRVQSKTLSACSCLRQWEIHVFVNILQDSSCRPSSLLSIFSQRKLQSVVIVIGVHVINFM